MAGYQPRHDTDPVWWNGTKINHLDITSTGVGVRVTGVFGWDDRPDVRDVREQRSGQDGEYADNLFIGGRTITLEGEVYGSSWVNLQARKRTLAALFIPSSDEVLLKIPDPATVSPTTSYSTTGMTGYERVSARVIEGIEFGDTLDPMCQTWQVVLRASDPRVYSDTETSTDSGTTGTAARTVTVDQGGTYDTPPTVTVTGPTGSTFAVVEPSGGLILSMSGLTLTASDTVVFDTLARTVAYTAGYESTRVNRSGILAIWMLDETSGTTADNGQGDAGRDGTYTGGFTLNQAGPASGLSSVALNGTTGYVAFNDTDLYPALDATYEGWLKLDSGGSGTDTWFDFNNGNDGHSLAYDHSAQQLVLTVGYGGQSQTHNVAASALAADTWYHIVVTTDYVGGSLYPNYTTVYINGVSFGTYTTYGLRLPAAYTARLGSSLAGTNFFDGNIGPFALYDVAVSAVEAAELYQASSSPTVSAYSYLDAETARWATLGTGSSVHTLSSSGLNTGSKLNVSYRDARL